MSKSKRNWRRWWEDRSAADDGLDTDDGVEVVDVDEDEDSWLDTFRFDDYRTDRGKTSVESIWSRYGGYSDSVFSPTARKLYTSNGADIKTARKIEAAQKLVQGFIDTFALETPLRARFSDSSRPVPGGDEGERAVVVSHRPLLDRTISEEEAHTIMTAQAANAAAKARYGARSATVRGETFAVYGSDPLALEVSDILDGYRVDHQFRDAYPGYADVYAPAQAYVAKGLLGDEPSFSLDAFQGASIANAALNYAEWTDWDGRESERDWWTDWAQRYLDPKDHVAGVAAALEHLALDLPPKPQGGGGGKPQQDPEQEDEDDENGGGAGGAGGANDEQDEDEDEQDEEPEGQQPTPGASDDRQDDEQDASDSPSGAGSDSETSDDRSGSQPVNKPIQLPTSLGKGVDLTSRANGLTRDISEYQADDLAQTASALTTGATDKELGEVYWSARGIAHRERRVVKAESSANGYIRRAFTRSRTAHFATERGHKTGRLDNRSLTRIASDDYRLFSKRTAPSATRYRVWLLIDNSGSMNGGAQRQAAQLAAAVALASRYIPNVRLDIWAWTTAIKITSASFSAVRIWSTGDPIANVSDLLTLPSGGTPDAEVFSWASRTIREQCLKDEVPVILMASDGAGSLSGEVWARNGYGYMSHRPDDRVAAARARGIKCLSVAIGVLRADMQDAIWGQGNHILWKGSIKAQAKPFGDLLARIATGHR